MHPNANIKKLDTMPTTEGLNPISLSNMPDDQPTVNAMAIVGGSSNGNSNTSNNKNGKDCTTTMMKYHIAWQAIKIILGSCRYFEPTFQQLAGCKERIHCPSSSCSCQ